MVIALKEGADICLGSRFKGRIKPGAMPLLNRYLGNPVLSGIFRILFRLPVSDAHCGLRALKKSTFERLHLDSDGMEFATEMVLKAALLGLRYDEKPVTLSPDQRHRAPHLLPWRDGWRHLRYMLMLTPLWLFFGPAIAFALLAVIIAVPLFLQPDGTIIFIAGLPFGDHWMILVSALLIVAFQAALFGLASTIHGVREEYRRVTPATLGILKISRLENFILLSVILLAVGIAIFSGVFLEWVGKRFGGLSAIRELMAATTLGVLAMQSFFGGFLISIIAGNRASPEDLTAIKIRSLPKSY